jgi:hypothetical protein
MIRLYWYIINKTTMKQNNQIFYSFYVILMGLLSSCIAPVNLTYQSGRTLEKGAFDIQASHSRYYYNNADKTSNGNNINNNFGIAMGYGITDSYNLRFRYEYAKMHSTYSNDFLDLHDLNSMSVIEVENKFKFKYANVSFGLPLSFYFFNRSTAANIGVMVLDPRFYLTMFSSTNIFELTVVPKAHIFVGQGFAVMPGFSVGMGISNNLKQWAIRPEIGFDGYVSFGVGLTVSLNHPDKK